MKLCRKSCTELTFANEKCKALQQDHWWNDCVKTDFYWLVANDYWVIVFALKAVHRYNSSQSIITTNVIDVQLLLFGSKYCFISSLNLPTSIAVETHITSRIRSWSNSESERRQSGCSHPISNFWECSFPILFSKVICHHSFRYDQVIQWKMIQFSYQSIEIQFQIRISIHTQYFQWFALQTTPITDCF